MKLEALVKEVKYILDKAGIVNVQVEAEYIISQILGKDRLSIYLDFDEEISSDDFLEIMNVVDLRIKHIPLQYIFGESNFYGRKFKVDEHVLIPRPESELLVDKVIELSNGTINPKILEIGSGSGALSISVALSLSQGLHLLGVDISQNALKISEINKRKYGVNSVEFIKSDLFEKVTGSFDIIFSNPPYISETEYSSLSKEVKKEPKLALIAKNDGYFFYEAIADKVQQFLKPSGHLVFEIGATQGPRIKKILSKYFKNILIKKDYNGLDRVVVANQMIC